MSDKIPDSHPPTIPKSGVEKDSVQLLCSFLPLPIGPLAVHTWLVTHRANGEVHRWEVWAQSDCCETSWGHLHRDLFPPYQGIGILPFFLPQSGNWNGQLVAVENSGIAGQIISFLERSVDSYPYKNRYGYFPGPNSNSFISWVLQHFPNSCLKIPGRAVGAEYKVPVLNDWIEK